LIAAPGTFVDSSVLLDVFTEDPAWLAWSESQLTAAAQRGSVIINAVVLAELAPRFSRVETLRASLPSMGSVEAIPIAASFLAGHAHAEYRRAGGSRQAILPDFLIGAHAAVTGRPLLTRDPRRVAAHIPGAALISPLPRPTSHAWDPSRTSKMVGDPCGLRPRTWLQRRPPSLLTVRSL
jgi:predicted nucleic acid-binding protein